MVDNAFLSRLSVINYAPMHRLSVLRNELHAAHYCVLDLDGTGVSDAVTFFRAASAQLLGGEPMSNWDSFADVMGNHVALLESDQTALVWTEAQKMLSGNLHDLIAAADVLTGIAREMYANSRTFVTFLVGTGPNFE